MKDIRSMDLNRIMIYSELIIGIVNDLSKFGKMTAQCAIDEGIDESSMHAIHSVLEKEITILETQRVELAKELTRRVKHDLGLKKGPGDYDAMLNRYLKEHIYIGRSKEEIEALKKKSSENKSYLKKK